MRRLRRVTRPFIALFALWFAVVVGDPGVLHACAMHGGSHGAHGPSRGAHGAASMPAGGTAHAGHGMAAMDSSQGATQDHDAAALCTCVGHCSAASTVAPLPAATTLHVPAEVRTWEDPLAAPRRDVPAAPDLRLPFANGPPIA